MSQTIEWPQELAAAAALLIKATNIADSLQRQHWDFAVEISDLLALGLTGTDLRWLTCAGLVEHSTDSSTAESNERTFLPSAMLTFDSRSCFVLSEEGFSAAKKTVVAARKQLPKHVKVKGAKDRIAEHPHELQETLKPSWNADLLCLLIGSIVVKQFRAPAPNQHLILAVFEEDGWPSRIDDPLPPSPAIDPKERLHEAIARLNRNQKNRVIRFRGDGSGRGVTWCRW